MMDKGNIIKSSNYTDPSSCGLVNFHVHSVS